METEKFSHNPNNSINHSSFFLLGLTGSGKSFWADKLSSILNITSFHLDEAIEQSEQKTIAQIFGEKGESYFRNKETEILKSFSNKNSFILSVGGGTPCFNNNMEWMNENGITIWIDEPVETIEKRLRAEKSHRPLIANIPDEKLHAFLSDMLSKRKEFYTQAKHHLQKNDINESAFLNIFSLYE
jgi:shikimate kinase